MHLQQPYHGLLPELPHDTWPSLVASVSGPPRHLLAYTSFIARTTERQRYLHSLNMLPP